MRTFKIISDKDYMENKKEAQREIPNEITLEFFSALVKRMRHLQRRYFATRSKEVLAESKKIEAQVDAVLDKIYNRDIYTLF